MKFGIYFGVVFFLSTQFVTANDSVDFHDALPTAPDGQVQSPRPVAPETKKETSLVKANSNGNPGFQFYMSLGGRAVAACQATLISAGGGICMILPYFLGRVPMGQEKFQSFLFPTIL